MEALTRLMELGSVLLGMNAGEVRVLLGMKGAQVRLFGFTP